MKYIIVLVIFFAASTTYALTVNISGTITQVSDSSNSLGGAVSAGDTFSGSYTYDDTPDVIYNGTNISQYEYTTGINGVKIEINGLTFETDLSSLYFLVEVHNDRAVTNDVFLWHSYYNTVSSGIPVDTISWELKDNSRTALTSTHLPDTVMDLSAWPDFNWLAIHSAAVVGSDVFIYDIYGTVTFTEAAPAIPEPLSLLLCAIGGILIKLRKRIF
ncbi:MAG: hypothetical protein AB1454_02000 [Candidatus Auribacterota bacterium]